MISAKPTEHLAGITLNSVGIGTGIIPVWEE